MLKIFFNWSGFHISPVRRLTAPITDCAPKPRGRDHTTMPRGAVMVMGIASAATDAFAERETVDKAELGSYLRRIFHEQKNQARDCSCRSPIC
jgi:hypothetical protein